MIEIPEAFARGTAEREGQRGAAWLAELPGITEHLFERWDCVQEGEITHGAVGVIVPVRRRDGGSAVIKVSFPHPGNVHEPDAFAAWGGRGAVLLYERADEHFAMLLERAGTSTLAQAAEVEEMVTVAGRVNRRLAVPAPPGLPRLRERAGEWEEELRKDAEELAHTMPPYVVDAAVATVRELGRFQPDVVIHGDLHPGNILRAEREPWLAVDPKGYAGDPAYDGGTLLKALAPRLLGAGDLRAAVLRALAVFAEAAELDHDRVLRWVQFHAVRTAFWGRRHGYGIARSGQGLDSLTELADHLATQLTGRPS
ncbi:aminoglycoside phosphotransferase family protein [Nonomuraea sp. NPDC048892]|uniref:aminoglycoside phosphotransferase family protein n=1 Tax=Nonomuraea sp. NPDC048892 TaxID=3154624 RepID=UPI003410C62A